MFDGASMVFDETGHLVARAKQFDRGPPRRRSRRAPRVPPPAARPARPVARRAAAGDHGERSRTSASAHAAARIEAPLPPVREVYEALVLGTRDYVAQERVHRRGDRAVGRDRLVAGRRDRGRRARPGARRTACSCRRASRAKAASPTPTSSPRNLGIRTLHRPDRGRPRARSSRCSPNRSPAPDPGLAEENLQARIRGTILMTMSNKFGWLVLTTGNKSEIATGYSTLYGDMAGGFSVIKDVPKMLVYALSPRPQRARRPRADPRGGAREAAQRGAAARPEGLRLAPRVRRARPDHRGLRRGRPVDRRARGRGARPRHGAARGRSSSTATSTSVGRPPRGAGVAEGVRQGPPPADHQPLARLTRVEPEHAACEPDGSPGGGRAAPRGAALRDHLPARPRRARTTSRRSGTSSVGSGIATLLLAPVRRRRAARTRARTGACSCAPGVVAGLLMFGGYATQTIGLQYTSPSTSAFITGLYVVITPADRVGDQCGGSRVPPVMAGDACSRRSACTCSPAPTCRLGTGELLTLACAVLFALPHRVPRRVREPVAHRCRSRALQIGAVALLSVAAHRGAGRRAPDRARRCSRSCSPVSCARSVALPLQLWGQRRHHAEPGRADPAGRAGVRRASPATSTANASGRAGRWARS